LLCINFLDNGLTGPKVSGATKKVYVIPLSGETVIDEVCAVEENFATKAV